MSKKAFQKKANDLFLQYPKENKIFITKNGQCFFDEKAASDYHDKKGFDGEPEVFFRDGFEDEDDKDIQEVLNDSELKRKELESIIEEVAIVTDLEQEYEPVSADTNEVVTSVIALREKYITTNNLLIEANINIEALQEVSQENENLKSQLDALNKELQALQKSATNEKAK